jgi:hypothetical protein
MIYFTIAWLVVAGFNACIGLAFYDHVHSPRWDVKTLADRFTAPTTARTTTIHEQHSLQTCVVGENSTRLSTEKDLLTLRAKLVESLLESDGDYHLVLQEENTGLQMVAEIPAPIEPVPEQYRSLFYRARRSIDSLIGTPTDKPYTPIRPPIIEVTGIGFFDEPHVFVPHGMAPNCREIHPVLRIRPL